MELLSASTRTIFQVGNHVKITRWKTPDVPSEDPKSRTWKSDDEDDRDLARLKASRELKNLKW